MNKLISINIRDNWGNYLFDAHCLLIVFALRPSLRRRMINN